MIPLSPLVAVAIGDAYALPFEYRAGAYAQWWRLNDGAHYERHTKYLATCPLGNASDDTHLSVSIAEVMLTLNLEKASSADFTTACDAAFKRAFLRNPQAGTRKECRQASGKPLTVVFLWPRCAPCMAKPLNRGPPCGQLRWGCYRTYLL
jgi:hypothetical protein